MPGREDFSQPGSKGSGQRVAVSNRPEIKHVSANQTASLASGGSEVVEFYPPAGSIYHVIHGRLVAPADGTWASGYHKFELETAGSVDVALLKCDFDGNIQYQRSSADVFGSNPTILPADGLPFMTAVSNLQASENAPVKVVYTNGADAAQDNTREIEFVFEEMSY